MALETYVKKVRDAVLAVKLVDDYVSYHHVPVDWRHWLWGKGSVITNY